LALIEPVIQHGDFTVPGSVNPGSRSAYRKDLWDSRSAAETAISRNPFYRALDPRVLQRYLQYGLRETPTLTYPNVKTEEQGSAVTLTTTRSHESWLFLRSNLEPQSDDWDRERLLSPDLEPRLEGKYLFWRAEITHTMENLPNVRPSILWVYGSKSHINTEKHREHKMRTTGTGRGGNGGAEKGRVKEVVVNGSHLVCLETPNVTAEPIASWFGHELTRWKAEEKFYAELGPRHSNNGIVASTEYLKKIKLPWNAERPIKGKL
jgi:hypothetical protein